MSGVASVRIGDLVSIKGGGTPAKSRKEFYAGDIPWVTPKDMKRWEISSAQDKITDEAIKKSSTNLIPENSVLVVNRSGILKHTVPVAIARRPVAINQDMKALICGAQVDPNYLARVIKAAEPTILGWVRATTADNYPIESLKSLEIPLPPLEEQMRIAAILDQADSLRRLRQRAIGRLNTLGQAIFYEMFGDPFYGASSESHKEIRLLCEVSSGSTPSRKDDQNFGGLVPWVKTGEVNGTEIMGTEETVTDKGISAARLKMYPAGTVLVAMYGQGKTRGQVGLLGVPATTNQACAALVCGPEIIPHFLFEQLKIGYSHLRRLGQGGNQPNLNAGLVKQFRVLVPDIAQQRAFVVAVDELSRVANRSLTHLSKNDKLLYSLQHRAFRGEL